MNIRVHQKDTFRIYANDNNFIDIDGELYEAALGVRLYPRFHYIEIRQKDNFLKMFLFNKKGSKKYVDLGWWEDAEVIFAKNEVINKDK